ncbi:MAG: DUF2784 domain-containing protein [Deltaproteobacteria bacterium]|nr:MAG: DUF2784 domain-containing protein [Deltaproteobacteria bacterium]
MGYRLAADLTLILHLLFIIFILFGGLLCLHRIRWAWLHLPAIVWGVWVEWTSGICPLTPLENYFRQRSSDQGYPGGFIVRYLIPIIYPEQLTILIQWLLGALVLVINIFVYLYVFRKKRKRDELVDE